MLVTNRGIDLIKKFEAFSSEPYLDVALVPTIGYGSTYYEDGTRVTLADPPIDEVRATKLLLFTVNNFARQVLALIKVELSENKFDALISLVYNIGINAFKKSTLLKKLNNGDFIGAAEQFLVWNKARVKGILQAVPGLTNRRYLERALFLE